MLISIPFSNPEPLQDHDYVDESEASVDASVGGNRGHGNVVAISEGGRVTCRDTGIFAHPTNCRKFVQCALQGGGLRGWVHTCSHGLSFDPVGGLCNWSIVVASRANCIDV